MLCVSMYIYIYIYFCSALGILRRWCTILMKAWTITCASLVNRDTCSKDLFEMYRALNLLKICIRGRNAYVEELFEICLRGNMTTWKNSLKYAYVEELLVSKVC